MEAANQLYQLDGYVDWRNRPAVRGRHGGILAASFVLLVEILENLAFLSNASNLVLYVSKFMAFSPSSSVNIVTNFMGTAFLLALLGGFLADAFFSTYHIYLTSAAIEFVGMLILTIRAHTHSLMSAGCSLADPNTSCVGGNAVLFFTGLYLVALGVGGIKGSLPPHGAEQFDDTTPKGRKQRSAFFNNYVFCLSCGALVAVTFVVWIEDNKGWQWGFGISTATILISIPVFLVGSPLYRTKVPVGSPITTIFKVLSVAVYSRLKSRNPSDAAMETSFSCKSHPYSDLEANTTTTRGTEQIQTQTEGFEFLNEAQANKSIPQMLYCTTRQVDDVKIVIKTLPAFMSTIVLNCCLAQLSTFSLQQAATMNTQLGSLRVPPASLPVFPVIFIVIFAPVYNHIINPLARKITKTEMGITHLQRIGTGLVLSIVAMGVAALVETKRKKVAVELGMTDSPEPLPITFLWVALQYMFLGSADLFSLAGMMDFFFSEAPLSMRSLATALSWASLAIGYYLSSVLVSTVNYITSSFGNNTPWLLGSNLNHYHLERFYWMLCALSGLNLLQYFFWANRYNYRFT